MINPQESIPIAAKIPIKLCPCVWKIAIFYVAMRNSFPLESEQRYKNEMDRPNLEFRICSRTYQSVYENWMRFYWFFAAT